MFGKKLAKLKQGIQISDRIRYCFSRDFNGAILLPFLKEVSDTTQLGRASLSPSLRTGSRAGNQQEQDRQTEALREASDELRHRVSPV
jgi:hypothetical protein